MDTYKIKKEFNLGGLVLLLNLKDNDLTVSPDTANSFIGKEIIYKDKTYEIGAVETVRNDKGEIYEEIALLIKSN